MIPDVFAPYITVQYSTVYYSTVQYSIVYYSTVQYNALELLILPEEERLSRELPDTPGGYGQPPIDVGVVRVRGVYVKVSQV